jgi:hypothetical protein
MNISKPIQLILIFLLVFQAGAFAQEIRENENGEKLVVYPNGSWRYFSESTIRPAGTFPVLNDTISSLEITTNLTEDVVRKLIYRKSQIAQEANELAQERIAEAVRQRQKISNDLEALKKREGLNSENVKRTQIRLDAAFNTEQSARKEAMLAKNELKQTSEMTQKGNLMEAFVQKQKDRAAKIELNTSNYGADVLSSQLLLPDEFRYDDILESNNLFIHPPKAACQTAFNGYDENIRRRRKDMPAKRLFAHTDERLRLHMKGKEYLECKAYLSSIDGGFRILNLEFTFAYPNAREAYGFIEKGSILTLLFLNGDYINLQAGVLANGQYDMQTEVLTYRVQYPVNPNQVTYLKKNEVDRVRVYWSSGYEEYEVFELDFFMDQSNCLGW